MKSQTAQLSKVLKASIGTFGVTLKEMEGRLGKSRGHLTRLFAGEFDLKVDHVVEIAELLGVDPEEIFRLAFPASSAKEPSEATLQLRQALGGSAPEGQPQEPSSLQRELQREIESIVNRALGKAFARLNG
jgi:transcriptional regulator with XRE-family HTH domain